MDRSDFKATSWQAQQVREHIDSLVDCMQRIESPDSPLTTDFHTQLASIDRLSAQCPEARPSLLAYCLRQTAAELSQSTIHRHGRDKPFGYAGDFQVIDWTYTKFNQSTGRGWMWDEFYHRQDAPLAVCDRKVRFGQYLLAAKQRVSKRPLRVLNVASGPCRELLDGSIAAGIPPSELEVVCVDTDQKANEYARALLGPEWASSVTFHHGNALRYKPSDAYDLIWCAGLFDYLEHRLAVLLTRKLWRALAPQGCLVIGNFSTTHRTRPWIEWCGNWHLIHRSESDFDLIAVEANIPISAKTHSMDQWQAIRFLTAVKHGD